MFMTINILKKKQSIWKSSLNAGITAVTAVALAMSPAPHPSFLARASHAAGRGGGRRPLSRRYPPPRTSRPLSARHVPRPPPASWASEREFIRQRPRPTPSDAISFHSPCSRQSRQCVCPSRFENNILGTVLSHKLCCEVSVSNTKCVYSVSL